MYTTNISEFEFLANCLGNVTMIYSSIKVVCVSLLNLCSNLLHAEIMILYNIRENGTLENCSRPIIIEIDVVNFQSKL